MSNRDSYSKAYRLRHPERVRAQNRASTKKTYDKRKALLAQLKRNAKCLDCGGLYAPHILEFDHRDPATKVDVVTKLGAYKNHAMFLAEIAKCDIVCANCHNERTYQRRKSDS